MKSDERHRLKENPVMKYVSKAVQWAIPHAGKIVTGVIIILLIIMGSWYYNYKQQQKNEKAGIEISRTMEDLGIERVEEVKEEKITLLGDLVNNFKSTKNGAVLSYKLGKYYYEKDEYEKAKNYLNIAKDNLEDNDYIKHMLANLLIEQQKYSDALTVLQSINKKYELYDNILYLIYISAEKTDKEKIVSNVKREFEKEKYNNSKYYSMIKIREAL
ncbi:MAG: tetratricopeptide repeat protein [Candidatus Mcinerneyibacterium aminivorans]|uniref:Tetratricopeptide repeat protein n=1 Tax=Candidatus Mcinerneyibacterium aminivorans TaxID=2703815 RepID=A0A5D0MJ05_9BACT|nr:MAG: tetratricopeptide repeat protein [Candidatus Mcinerneyibacterium aminivorans]